MVMFGLPDDYAKLSDTKKVRALLALDPAAPIRTVREKLEFTIDNRIELQNFVIEATRTMRQFLDGRGFDELSAPQ